MLRRRMNSIVTTGLLAALLCLAPTAVRAAEISDGAKFFSAEALATANQSIRDLEKKSGHEVRIETFAAVPADKVDAVGKMESKQRDAFFSKWVFERAEATKSRGIVMLICREPSHLNVWVGNPLQKAGFGNTQAKAVQEVLLARMKAKEYDMALTEAVAQLSTAFGGLSHAKAKTSTAAPATHESKRIGHVTPASPNHAPGHQTPMPAPQQSGWTGVLVVLMFVVGGIFVVSLISRLFGGGRSSGAGGYGSGGYGGGGGGGGFMSSLTGGIFGAMAGNWMYDQFSGRHASGGESHATGDTFGSNDSSGSTGLDSGSGSSDSGFDGGTDFGGGDFGGGGDSSGGSDFGGGGDF
ncbi:MAG: TPM domain-containing protein [Planctomycetota bacterium]